MEEPVQEIMVVAKAIAIAFVIGEILYEVIGLLVQPATILGEVQKY